MNVNLIGVPIHLGCDREGAQFGPEALREKKVIDIIKKSNHNIYDCGNIYVPKVAKENKYAYHQRMKYLDPIVEVNTNLAHQVYTSLAAGNFPFIIGGDHSLGLGSISGASRFYKNLGVVWVDAHADLNTYETSPSGNVHGMPLAAAMGIGCPSLTDLYYTGVKVKPENVFIVAARDVDEGETRLIEEKKLNVYTMEEVKERGIAAIMQEIEEKLRKNHVDAVHLSFDLDALDSNLVPGTGTPVINGMSVEEVKYLFKHLIGTNLVKSMDMVELNTLLDRDGMTTEVTIDLIDWAFQCIDKTSKDSLAITATA